MSQNLERLKELLKKMFQLDQADLDFGIYRIMNARREEITRFLDHDLLPQVRQVLEQYEKESRAAISEELEKAKEQAKALGFDDPTQAPKVKELQARYNAAFDVEAAEQEVFSHLYNFFRRYYSEGDFISQRRYKEGVYAIPYEGEEVKLYWANHDQYYIKTSEYLRNYTFKLPSGKRVHFKLVQADTEKDNNLAANGKERRFILSAEQPMVEENGELVIRFEYRPDPEKRKQAELNAVAVERILNQTTGFDDWRRELAALRPTEKNPNRTLLEKHLTDYTSRNTFDYFIHKDLGGFLRRELDFYIKNEVMHLDDIENETAPRVEQYLSKIKAIRRIAHKIIDFLAQIENFQKKLWLKKKFVVETQYCITLDRIFAIEDEETRNWLIGEIIKNDAQRKEWAALYGDMATGGQGDKGKGRAGDTGTLFADDDVLVTLSPSLPVSSSASHTVSSSPGLRVPRSLTVDTRHFDEAFKLRLLAAIPELDEETDGLLIHSENFQALNLLQTRYREQVKCIYIDPPYNTGSDEFIYRDDYQHSSWLAMMHDRLLQSHAVMSRDAALFVSIGNDEVAHLRLLLESALGSANFRSTIIYRRGIKSVQAQFDTIDRLNQGYDFLLMASKSESARFKKLMVPKDENGDGDETEIRGTWNNHWRSTDRPSMRYPLFGITPSSGQWRWSRERSEAAIENYRRLCQELGTSNPSQEQIDKWVIEKEAAGQRIDLLRLSATGNPEHYVKPSSEKLASDLWTDLKPNGSYQLQALFGAKVFENPKSTNLVERLLKFVTDEDSFALDFFAGSGTTGHAVINLNREDGGRRKFILVEMGEHFDTVLVPRLKKVIFTPEWKDGKPKRLPTPEEVKCGPHILKILRLESYEDTLNNLELKRTKAQQTLLEQHAAFREDYMLHYMLDVESRGSASLLNIDRFEDPFNYKLNIATGTAGETKPTAVDLVETFNYLIGLRVKTIDHIGGVRVVTGTNPQGERVLILWRNTKELDNDALDAWFRKQGYNTNDQEYDVIYVNGDNNLENLRKANQTWKVRLIEEEFKRLMFDVQDV